MPAPNAFGGTAILAMFQGVLSHAGPVPTLTVYSAYGCSVAANATAGQVNFTLQTGTTDNNVLAQVNQFGPPGGGGTVPIEVDITQASLVGSETFLNGVNQAVSLAFKSGGVATDPIGMFNVVFYGCEDGVDVTP